MSESMNWKPLLAIISSMIMMYITSFSINVLIGPIVEDLNWSISGLQLVIVSASLIAGTLMVTAGRLGDKIGKKKVFLIGSILYTIGITMVVMSPNSFMFSIAWAVVWPLGMVMVIPTSISMIMYFYQGDQRASAFGIYGAVLSVVSAIAPIVLGAMTNSVGWRLALALSPAFGIITIILAFFVPETDKDSSIKIDPLSVVLSVVSFGALLLTTSSASTYGWIFEKRPFVIGDTTLSLGGLSVIPLFYVLSFVLLFLFFKRGAILKAKAEYPLLDASILNIFSYRVGMPIQALLYFLVAALLFTVSVFVQSAAHFDSLNTALTTVPASAAVALFSFFTPGLGKKIAPKWIVIAGLILTIVGITWVGATISSTMGPFTIAGGMIVFGIGAGLIMAQIATLTMADVPAEQGGGASGLSETMKEIVGQGFAIAFSGAILFGAVYSNMTNEYERVEGLELSEAQQAQIIIELEDTFQEVTEASEREFVQSLPEKTQTAYAEIVKTSSEKAFTSTMWVINFFAAIALIIAFFLPATKAKD